MMPGRRLGCRAGRGPTHSPPSAGSNGSRAVSRRRIGGAGPLPITDANLTHPLLDAFVEAGVQAGYPFTADFNAAPFEGVGRYHFNIAGGQRWSASRAYLDPARGRPNLRIITGAHVQRVLIEARACHRRANRLRPGAGWRGGAVRRHGELAAIAHALRHRRARRLICARHRPGCRRAGGWAQFAGPFAGPGGACLHPADHPAIAHPAGPGGLRPGAGAGGAHRAGASFPLAAGFFLRSAPGLEEPDLQGHFLPGLTTGSCACRASPGRPGWGMRTVSWPT